ncbi:MAG: hypothetical protein Q7R95_04230 [bacterium]|nr:hypothetical protein [bacterium]
MKVTIYTITDCEFSKQEKAYLTTNKIQFEEKNLETNKDWLTEMLAVSNNFAGTPVTKIEKDDGKIVVLKGFTKEEFDTTLGFTPPPAQTAQTVPPIQAPTSAPTTAPFDNAQGKPLPPIVPTPVEPVVIPPAQEVPAMPPIESLQNPTPAPIETPNPLNAVLQNLESKSSSIAEPTPAVQPPTTIPTVTPPVPPVVPTPGLPNIPDFQDKV